jgi:quercetin dioxygenase-like cupin family protein
MEERYNEATINRPEGTRAVDAPVITIDIDKFVKQLKGEKAWEDNDRNAITVFKSDRMRVVIVALHKHAELTTEKPQSELSIQVLKGRLEVSADGRNVEVEEGQIVALQQAVNYHIEAVKKSVVILTVVNDKENGNGNYRSNS